MKMLYALVIGLLFVSFLTPLLAAQQVQQAQQSYTVHFYASFIAGDDDQNSIAFFSHTHHAVINVDGKDVATDAFIGSGELSTTVTLDGSSPHTITASLDNPPPFDAADADCWSGWSSGNWCTNPNTADHADIFGGSLYVNGNRCAQSSAVSSILPLSCTFGANQPVPNLSNGLLTLPMTLIVLLGAFVVFKKRERPTEGKLKELSD